MCDFDLWGTTTSKESLLLDERADSAVCIVKGALRLVEDEVVGAAADNGDSVDYRLDTGNFDVACA